MAVTVTKVDSLQTRIMQSFVNLTVLNSTLYPATTTTQFEYNDTTTSGTPVLTAYFVYDQWAFRTTGTSPLTAAGQ